MVPMTIKDLAQDTEVLAAYRAEAEERILEIEAGLKALAHQTGQVDENLLHRMFRCAHSVKAGANLLELRTLEIRAHSLENLFDELRKGKVTLDASLVDQLFERLDDMGLFLDAMRKSL
jgi:two-component system chemotaxis sensor kinase CheA